MFIFQARPLVFNVEGAGESRNVVISNISDVIKMKPAEAIEYLNNVAKQVKNASKTAPSEEKPAYEKTIALLKDIASQIKEGKTVNKEESGECNRLLTAMYYSKNNNAFTSNEDLIGEMAKNTKESEALFFMKKCEYTLDEANKQCSENYGALLKGVLNTDIEKADNNSKTVEEHHEAIKQLVYEKGGDSLVRLWEKTATEILERIKTLLNPFSGNKTSPLAEKPPDSSTTREQDIIANQQHEREEIAQREKFLDLIKDKG